MVTISLKVRTRKWIIAGGIGWVFISLVIHAAAQSKTNQLTDTSVASHFASSQHIRKNWTSFRGPVANGLAAHANPPLDWSVKDGRNILWKTRIPRHGMSSPIIWENRLFLTGADDSTRQIYCYDADTGKLLCSTMWTVFPALLLTASYPTYWTKPGSQRRPRQQTVDMWQPSLQPVNWFV